MPSFSSNNPNLYGNTLNDYKFNMTKFIILQNSLYQKRKRVWELFPHLHLVLQCNAKVYPFHVNYLMVMKIGAIIKILDPAFKV